MRALVPFLGMFLGGLWQLFTGRVGGSRNARKKLDGRGTGL